jgi:hypothetical protein
MLGWSRALGKALARFLSAPRDAAQTGTPTDPEKLGASLRPGDVLLVEGASRISTAVKYLTQSTWSHAALYVGPQLGGHDDQGRPYLFVEADLVLGVCKRPLAQYTRYHTRICRPRELRPHDLRKVLQRVVGQVGHQYDMKNVWDLARFLLPQPPIPARWRRKLIALGSGDPTKAICSSLIAEAFQGVGYPVLPVITQQTGGPDGRAARDIFHIRHHSLYAPRDFDVSPYFEVVKPTLAQGFDYQAIEWSQSTFSGLMLGNQAGNGGLGSGEGTGEPA